MWFDIVGNSLAFIGSVIFSAGLLQTPEQVEAENKTYWGANPFTTKSGLSSRVKNVIAFLLVVFGFSVTIGGSIGEGAKLSPWSAIAVSGLIGIAGCGLIVLIYQTNKRQFETNKKRYDERQFYVALKSMMENHQRWIGHVSEKPLFDQSKPKNIEDLRRRLEEVYEPQPHMQEVIDKLSRTRTPSGYIRCTREYLKKHANVLLSQQHS
jgi:hypothetical protein